jgi:hypothetical protein
MQRVHIDDLTGFLLAQSDEWDVLSLPAVADSDETIPLSAERTYRRRSGEALSPEREPLEVLDAQNSTSAATRSPLSINKRRRRPAGPW